MVVGIVPNAIVALAVLMEVGARGFDSRGTCTTNTTNILTRKSRIKSRRWHRLSVKGRGEKCPALPITFFRIVRRG